MKVKFNDIKSSFNEIRDSLEPKINKILYEDCDFIKGKELKSFENNFAKYIGTDYCVGVNSGTDALKLALKCLNLNTGDEVIVQNNTFVGSILGASELDLKIKLVNNDAKTYMVDINDLERKITSETKVIIIVHLYGVCPDMDRIMEIKNKYNLFLIEDCAQAHGCLYKEKKVGSFGELSCFSFYPGKNLGAAGDGGCVNTNSKEFYEKLEYLRNLGSIVKYQHDIKGYNSRLDTLQSYVLNEKLNYLDINNSKRRKIACMYYDFLKEEKNLQLPGVGYFCTPVWHLFVLRVINRETRDKLLHYLKNNEIEVSIHYPISINNSGAYKELREDILVNDYSDRILSIPMHPYLNQEEVRYICDNIKKFFISK